MSAPAVSDDRDPPPLPDELTRYLTHLAVERRLAKRTLALYEAALRRLDRLAADAGVALHDAQTHHLRRWTASLRGSDARGLGPRSIALTLSAWRGLYRWWGREGLVAANPVVAVHAPKAPKLLPKALSVEQAVALAGHEGEGGRPELRLRDHAIVELLYGSGLRVGELTALDRQPGPQAAGWVDLAEATAHVLGKGSKRRSVPVGRAAIEALQRWVAARVALARPDEPALFVSQRGTRLTAAQLRKRLRTLALEAGVPTHVHPHMLRHSFASHLLQSSGDLRAVQELLGHAHIGSTQVYTQLDFQHLARVYDAAHPRARRAPAAAPTPPKNRGGSGG